MADQIVAKNDGPKFQAHPEGTWGARCVDVVNLGDRVEQFAGKEPKVTPKLALVFQTGEVQEESGFLHEVVVEFTVSMGERANLRKFLESWRGKAYTEEQVEEGVPIHKLDGQPALISVAHHKSGSGRTYAKILTIMPLPKGMVAPTLPAYTRPDYLNERKKEYAEAVAKHRAQHAPTSSRAYDDYPDPLDGDHDDLPF